MPHIVFISDQSMIYNRPSFPVMPVEGQRICLWSDYLNVPDYYCQVYDTLINPPPSKCRKFFNILLRKDPNWKFLDNSKKLPDAFVWVTNAPELAKDSPNEK